MVFTLNLILQKSYLHGKFLYIQFHRSRCTVEIARQHLHLDRGFSNCFFDTMFNLCRYHGVQIQARGRNEMRAEIVRSIPHHP